MGLAKAEFVKAESADADGVLTVYSRPEAEIRTEHPQELEAGLDGALVRLCEVAGALQRAAQLLRVSRCADDLLPARMTKEEVAARLRLSVRTLERMTTEADKPEIAYRKFGEVVRFAREDVLAFDRKRTVKGRTV